MSNIKILLRFLSNTFIYFAHYKLEMAQDTSRIESMLFNYETTNRTDFRPTDIKAPVFTVYKEKPSCMRIRPLPLKDIHTLCHWKTVIPFNLLHRPRPFIDVDPTEVQKPYFEPPDEGKKQTIETRPRLVMTPAVSMDDIEDPRAREILIDNMYTSDMTKGMREGIRPYFRVAAPFPGSPASANPITLPKLVPPVVPPEWRMDSVTWDQRQLRAHCDSTKRFWLSRPAPQCNVCDHSNKMNAQKKMMCQMKPGKALTRR